MMSTYARGRIPPEAERVAEYVYHDEQGQPLYLKERWEWQEHGQHKKQFKLRAFAGYGAERSPTWAKYLGKDVRRVPYHLDKLRAGINAGVERIYLVDGEKDVETLEAHGQVATTTPMGTMSMWCGEWVFYFHGAKRVTLIADNDVTGQGVRDAWRVADSLKRVGILFEVVRTPQGKDVTEFLEGAA